LRIASREVDQDLVERDRIDPDPELAGLHVQGDVDVFRQEGAQHRQHVEDDPARVDDDRLERLATGEGEEPAGDRLGSIGRCDDLVEIGSNVALGQLGVGKLRVAADRCQEVVEVVADARRERTDRLEFLVLHGLVLRRALAGHVADIEHRPDIRTIDVHDRTGCHQRPEIGSIGPHEAHVDTLGNADRLAADHRLGRRLELLGQVLRDRMSMHGVRRRPEQPGHRLVDVGGPAVTADQPDAIEHAVEDGAKALHRDLPDRRVDRRLRRCHGFPPPFAIALRRAGCRVRMKSRGGTLGPKRATFLGTSR
jgi:hypothetical protein